MSQLGRAARLDEENPLARFRDRFVVADPTRVYLDGNSLGRLPRATLTAVSEMVEQEWGGELIAGWDHWMDLPTQVGDAIGAHVVGAAAGQVVVCDSTTINLYKLVEAALAARPGPVVASVDDFPTDRFVVASSAARHGRDVRWLTPDPIHGVQPDDVAAAADGAALVLLSHVQYRSGALADLAAITDVAHRAGALVLWDCSHSGGALPVDLDRHEVDLAVGCTYKYLNGGPGAPAWLYVRRGLHGELVNPIPGWMGAADVFAMAAAYRPDPGIRAFLTGTPPIPALTAVASGVALTAEAGIDTIRTVSERLTAYVIELFDSCLSPLGFELGTPRAADHRGGHVSIRHPDARRLDRRLRERGVVVDFRNPDSLRLGLSPLTTSFEDCRRAVEVLADLARHADGG